MIFPQGFKILGKNNEIVEIDSHTNAIQTVNHSIKELHDGNHYYMEGYVELDSGSSYYVSITTPTGKQAHFIWDITSTGTLTTTFDEDASGMTGGTSVTPINSDRNSSNSSSMTILKGVTAPTSYTTRISNQKFGSDSGRFYSSIGGADNPISEIILKEGTTYCRTFTSGSDGNIITFRADWHEHSD